MNEEQCSKYFSKEEPVLYRVSCNKFIYKWLCKACLKEIERG